MPFKTTDPLLLLILTLAFSPLRDEIAREFCRAILLEEQLAAQLPGPLLESLRAIAAPPPRLRLTTDD